MKVFKEFFTYKVNLIIVLSIIGTIIFGSLVKYHLDGGKKYPTLRKTVIFFASIPLNLKKMINSGSIFIDKQESLLKHKNKKKFEQFIPNKRNALLVLPRYDSDINRSIVEIIDLNNFEIIHTYKHDITKMNAKVQNTKIFPKLNTDHSPTRFRYFHPLIYDDGSLISRSHQSILFKIDFCSNLKWINDEQIFHHSAMLDHEKNILVGGWFNPYSKFVKKYQFDSFFEDDAITKINSNGKILYKKSVIEILIENKILPENFALSVKLENKKELDPLHLNDIEPALTDTQYWKKGDMFLSLRDMSSIVHYRPSNNKVINYIIGPFARQHDVDIVSDKEISIFNNNNFIEDNKYSEVLIYNFETKEFKKMFNEQLKKENFKTNTGGLSEILDDGSLLVDETNHGRIILFNNNGKKEFEFVNKGSDGKIGRIFWSRIIEDELFIEKYKSIVEKKKCIN